MTRLLLAALLVLIACLAVAPVLVATADIVDHPSKCYWCHSDEKDPHGVDNASLAWTYCSNCHSRAAGLAPITYDLVANSVHSNVGCKCHVVLHVGITSPAGAWLYYYVPNITKPVTVPPLANLTRKVVYYEEGYNDTLLVSNGLRSLTNTYTGDYYGVYMVFARPGLITSTTDRYLLCFNCHFLAANPAEVGVYRLEGGVLKIGIPPEALKLEPHSITKEVLESILKSSSAESLEEARVTRAALVGVLATVLTVFLVFVRRLGPVL